MNVAAFRAIFNLSPVGVRWGIRVSEMFMTTYVFACDEVDRFKESASGARWYLPGADVQDLKGTLAVQRL